MFTPCEYQSLSLTLPPQAINSNDEFHVSSLPAETVQRDFLVLSPQNRRKRHQTINPSSFTFTPPYGLARALLGPSCDFTRCEHTKGTVLLPKFKEIQLPPPPPGKSKLQDQTMQREDSLTYIQIWLLIIIRGVRYGVPFFLGPPRMGSPFRDTSPCLQLQCRNEQKRQQTNAERTFHNA